MHMIIIFVILWETMNALVTLAKIPNIHLKFFIL